MSKAFKRLWREAGLVRRYVAEVAKEWRAILGSTAVIALLWIAAHYGAAFLAQALPHVPQEAAPWLTRNRLIVASVFLVLAVAQYRAWRKLRRNLDGESPDIDPRLERIKEKPGSTKKMISEEPAFKDVIPDRVLVVSFRTKVSLDQPTITVRFSDGIYRIFGRSYNPQTRKTTGFPRPIKTLLYDKAVLSFGDETLPAGSKLSLDVYSPTPVRLISASVGGIDDDA